MKAQIAVVLYINGAAIAAREQVSVNEQKSTKPGRAGVLACRR